MWNQTVTKLEHKDIDGTVLLCTIVVTNFSSLI